MAVVIHLEKYSTMQMAAAVCLKKMYILLNGWCYLLKHYLKLFEMAWTSISHPFIWYLF